MFGGLLAVQTVPFLADAAAGLREDGRVLSPRVDLLLQDTLLGQLPLELGLQI